MRAKTLQIHWHDRQPIFSVDFEPCGRGRLATAGADCNVRIWRVAKEDNEPPKIEFLSSLNRHTASVNVVRWSPEGGILASAGDDGMVILWKQSEQHVGSTALAEDDEHYNRETWRIHSMLSSVNIYTYETPKPGSLTTRNIGKLSKIDVRAPKPNTTNSSQASSSKTSANNTPAPITQPGSAHVSDQIMPPLEIGSPMIPQRPLSASPAPLDQKNPTPSGTRKPTPPPHPPSTSSELMQPPPPSPKRTPIGFPPAPCSSSTGPTAARLPSPTPSKSQTAPNNNSHHNNHPKSIRMYHDETLTSFFRRLTFTPDGALLVTPAGQYRGTLGHYLHHDHHESVETVATEDEGKGAPEMKNTIYVYSRGRLGGPVAYELRGLKVSTPTSPADTAVVFAELKGESGGTEPASDASSSSSSPPTLFDLKYRLLFAVATQDSVLIYDTQHTKPLVFISNLHYATFTDMAWSPDGCTLLLASTDGYCSIVSFERNELGVPLPDDKVPRGMKPYPAHLSSPTTGSPMSGVTTSAEGGNAGIGANGDGPVAMVFESRLRPVTPPQTPIIGASSVLLPPPPPPSQQQTGTSDTAAAAVKLAEISPEETDTIKNKRPITENLPEEVTATKEGGSGSDGTRKKRRIVPTLIRPGSA
ncbi:hypothetical protein HK102_014105 [Quaeritorhiza haematococci]|nr:hypothetical protein HK102_014105 [Quaeritorhiza haematococci]